MSMIRTEDLSFATVLDHFDQEVQKRCLIIIPPQKSKFISTIFAISCNRPQFSRNLPAMFHIFFCNLPGISHNLKWNMHKFLMVHKVLYKKVAILRVKCKFNSSEGSARSSSSQSKLSNSFEVDGHQATRRSGRRWP